MISKTGRYPDARTTMLMQRQLVVLLHAKLCEQREQKLIMENKPVTKCQLPLCSQMKAVLNHMLTCLNGSNCEFNHCKSSRGILHHWRRCESRECPLCEPIRVAREENAMPNIGKLSLS